MQFRVYEDTPDLSFVPDDLVNFQPSFNFSFTGRLTISKQNPIYSKGQRNGFMAIFQIENLT